MPLQYWRAMKDEAAANFPEEACGLVAGIRDEVSGIFPIENILHSPVQYKMNPNEQIRTMLQLEKMGSELLGIYHSHPTGPPLPSNTDILEASYPDAIYFIWSENFGEWGCRGFLIKNKKALEIKINLF